MTNSIFMIEPYRNEAGIWAFDDANAGLLAEPFVGEINPMLDALSNFGEKCTLLFSSGFIPNSSVNLTKTRGDEFGTYYTVAEFQDEEVWLCPALFKYFDEAPNKITVRVTINEVNHE